MPKRRGAGQACRHCPGTRPKAEGPVSLNVIGVSPVAVTEKVPAVFSAKEVDAADVNTGAGRRTVSVKAWVDVPALASVAVMVIG